MSKPFSVLLVLMICMIALVTYAAGQRGLEYAASFIGDTYHRTLASYTVIDLTLHRFLVQYDVSRIGIAKFHRGRNNEFVATFNSMTASPGVSDDTSELQYIPAATLALVLPPLSHGEPIFIWTRDVPNSELKGLVVKRGVKALLHVPVMDHSQRLIGMITASWLDEGRVPDAAQRDQMAIELGYVGKRIVPYVDGLP